MFWCIVGINDWVYEVIDAIESNNDKVSQIVYIPPLVKDIPGYNLTPIDEFKPWANEKYYLSAGGAHWLFDKLNLEYDNIFHRTAIVPKSTQFGKGNFFGAGVIIATHVKIGNHNYFNRMCSIGHDTTINNRCIFSPGSTTCGACEIDDSCIIGAGATVRERLKLFKNTFVAAGALLITDTIERGTYMGHPAKKVPCPNCPDPYYMI